jgi:hypothetical protein
MDCKDRKPYRKTGSMHARLHSMRGRNNFRDPRPCCCLTGGSAIKDSHPVNSILLLPASKTCDLDLLLLSKVFAQLIASCQLESTNQSQHTKMPPAPPRVSNLQRRTITLLCFYFALTLNILVQEIFFAFSALRPHNYILASGALGIPISILSVKAHGWSTSEEGLNPFINLLLGSSGILALLFRSYMPANLKGWIRCD